MLLVMISGLARRVERTAASPLLAPGRQCEVYFQRHLPS